ncbi:hypothetical protein L873DRAFT_1693502, partial [Choiromyces venosus 120613-1]
KRELLKIFIVAHQSSFTSENIQSGFRNTGLVLVNRDIVIAKIQPTRPKSPVNHSSLTNSSISTS